MCNLRSPWGLQETSQRGNTSQPCTPTPSGAPSQGSTSITYTSSQQMTQNIYFHFLPLSFNFYSITSLSTRRDHLAMTKNFWCSCSRCCDATEFGSNISTIFDRCPLDYLFHHSSDFTQSCAIKRTESSPGLSQITTIIHFEATSPALKIPSSSLLWSLSYLQHCSLTN